MRHRARRYLALLAACAALVTALSRRRAAGAANTTAATRRGLRLVLLSAPRSGSTLLVEMLRGHASILMHGEPFHRSDVRGSAKDGFAGNVTVDDGAFAARHEDPGQLLEAIAARDRGRRVVGFKLFSKHLDWGNLGVFLGWATHVVLLDRSNRLSQYASICLAQKSNVWAAYPGEDHRAGGLNVSLRADHFSTWRDHQANFSARTREALAAVDAAQRPSVLELTYEVDLCPAGAARASALRRVEAFLGVEAGVATHSAPRLPVKQHPHDLRASVANWAAVAASDAAAPYAALPSGCAPGRRRLKTRIDWATKKFHDDAAAFCKEGGPGWL